jgi:signal transduction histidine kinase
VLNILNNAFYAVTEKKKTAGDSYQPSVRVSTKRAGNHIIIEIRDNGNGMPESVREKIFQPFFTTKPTGKGTGLGLSLSYEIITKGHGGTLDVESKEGEMTRFIIKLPDV